MLLFKFAKIVHISNGYVIIERNGEGYMVQMPNSQRVKMDDFKKIYLYEHTNEYKKSTYAFLAFKEWVLFQDILKLPGLGPKLAYGLLDRGYELICRLIAENNYESIAETPHISEKMAKQIVFQLSDKYQQLSKSTFPDNIQRAIKKESEFEQDLKNNLKRLGFKSQMISAAIEKNEERENIDAAIQNCIRIISNENALRTHG